MAINPEFKEQAVSDLYQQAIDVMNRYRSQTFPVIPDFMYEIGFVLKDSSKREMRLYHTRSIPIDYDEETDPLVELLPTSFQFPVISFEPDIYKTRVSSPYGNVPSAIMTPSGRKFWLNNFYHINGQGKSLKIEFIMEATTEDIEDDLFEPVNFEADENDVRLVEFTPGDFEYLGAELQRLLHGDYEVQTYKRVASILPK